MSRVAYARRNGQPSDVEKKAPVGFFYSFCVRLGTTAKRPPSSTRARGKAARARVARGGLERRGAGPAAPVAALGGLAPSRFVRTSSSGRVHDAKGRPRASRAGGDRQGAETRPGERVRPHRAVSPRGVRARGARPRAERLRRVRAGLGRRARARCGNLVGRPSRRARRGDGEVQSRDRRANRRDLRAGGVRARRLILVRGRRRRDRVPGERRTEIGGERRSADRRRRRRETRRGVW